MFCRKVSWRHACRRGCACEKTEQAAPCSPAAACLPRAAARSRRPNGLFCRPERAVWRSKTPCFAMCWPTGGCAACVTSGENFTNRAPLRRPGPWLRRGEVSLPPSVADGAVGAGLLVVALLKTPKHLAKVIKCCIFAEDKLHSGNCEQARFPLACIIFAEDMSRPEIRSGDDAHIVSAFPPAHNLCGSLPARGSRRGKPAPRRQPAFAASQSAPTTVRL